MKTSTTSSTTYPQPYTVAPFSKGDFAVTGKNPCAICARDIKDKNRAHAVEVTDGGGRWVGIGEKADENDGGYMGVHYVGPDCHKKYATKVQPEKKQRTATDAMLRRLDKLIANKQERLKNVQDAIRNEPEDDRPTHTKAGSIGIEVSGSKEPKEKRSWVISWREDEAILTAYIADFKRIREVIVLAAKVAQGAEEGRYTHPTIEDMAALAKLTKEAR